MRTCWYCGQRFDPDEEYYWVCKEHLDEGLIDVWGKDGKDLNTALGRLCNAKMNEEMRKQLADSFVFPKLVEQILPLMEYKELTNLLKRVSARCSSSPSTDSEQDQDT